MGDVARGLTVAVIATLDVAVLGRLDTPGSVWAVLAVLVALAVASATAFTLVERWWPAMHPSRPKPVGRRGAARSTSP